MNICKCTVYLMSQSCILLHVINYSIMTEDIRWCAQHVLEYTCACQFVLSFHTGVQIIIIAYDKLLYLTVLPYNNSSKAVMPQTQLVICFVSYKAACMEATAASPSHPLGCAGDSLLRLLSLIQITYSCNCWIRFSSCAVLDILKIV